MQKIKIKTNRRNEFIDITAKVANLVPENFNGICYLFSTHTTAGLTINENADPDVLSDINMHLNKLIPEKQDYFNHFEGNSDSHIKSSLMGFSEIIPIDNSHFCLGVWQSVYLCEFDGPRERTILVQFINE